MRSSGTATRQPLRGSTTSRRRAASERRTFRADCEPGGPRQAQRIENHAHAPVAENGRARQNTSALEDVRDRLDDDFLGIVDLVHHQTERAAVHAHHHDVKRGSGALAQRRVREGAPLVQQLAQEHQRQQRVAQPDDRGLVHLLDRVRQARRLDAQ
jgi:hypothetical protein